MPVFGGDGEAVQAAAPFCYSFACSVTGGGGRRIWPRINLAGLRPRECAAAFRPSPIPRSVCSGCRPGSHCRPDRPDKTRVRSGTPPRPYRCVIVGANREPRPWARPPRNHRPRPIRRTKMILHGGGDRCVPRHRYAHHASGRAGQAEAQAGTQAKDNGETGLTAICRWSGSWRDALVRQAGRQAGQGSETSLQRLTFSGTKEQYSPINVPKPGLGWLLAVEFMIKEGDAISELLPSGYKLSYGACWN